MCAIFDKLTLIFGEQIATSCFPLREQSAAIRRGSRPASTYGNIMTRITAAWSGPASNWIRRRSRGLDKRSAGVEVRHRTDQRAHPLRATGPHLPMGNAIITASASPTRICVLASPGK